VHNKTFIHFDINYIINRRDSLLELNPLNSINYSRALEKACMNCGDKHQDCCPVGMAKAQINSMNDLLVEFYKKR
jgi:hypothetical protein